MVRRFTLRPLFTVRGWLSYLVAVPAVGGAVLIYVAVIEIFHIVLSWVYRNVPLRIGRFLIRCDSPQLVVVVAWFVAIIILFFLRVSNVGMSEAVGTVLLVLKELLVTTYELIESGNKLLKKLVDRVCSD